MNKYDYLCTHDDKNIKGFFGDYRWLSNFYPAKVELALLDFYPSVEHAYQAAKVKVEYRFHFKLMTAAETKKRWKEFPSAYSSSEEWDRSKYEIMKLLVMRKFLNNRELGDKLVATGDKYLEETNSWNDTFFGVDINKGGENKLGEILMWVRDYILQYDH